MRFVVYFITAATFFLIVWIPIVGIIKLFQIVGSSSSTVIAFAFGGFISPLICFAIAVWFDKWFTTRKSIKVRQSQLRWKRRKEIDTLLDDYIHAVEHATSIKMVNTFERARKESEQYINERYEEKGLRNG